MAIRFQAVLEGLEAPRFNENDDPSVAKAEIWEDEDFCLPPSPSSVFVALGFQVRLPETNITSPPKKHQKLGSMKSLETRDFGLFQWSFSV